MPAKVNDVILSHELGRKKVANALYELTDIVSKVLQYTTKTLSTLDVVGVS